MTDIRKSSMMPGFTAEASVYLSDTSYSLKRLAPQAPVGSGRDPILISDYDPRWRALFELERQRILSTVGQRPVAIEHIGSSAVPRLGGRAEIDILLGAKDTKEIEECAKLLRRLGYHETARPPSVSDGWRLLEKAAAIPIGVLIVLYGGDLWRRHLWFRDYLRRHPEMARIYSRLKSQWATRYGAGTATYQAAKSRFVALLEERVRGG
jgi:GrpB-like predicted nucleotidyltransferase (UPF0157 family)